MKRIGRLSRCWGACLAAVAAQAVRGDCILAQASDAARLPISMATSLTLRAGTDENSYVVGQPIALHIEMVNASSKPVMSHPLWGWFSRAGTREGVPEYVLVVELSRNATDFGRWAAYGMPYCCIGRAPPGFIREGYRGATKVLLVPFGRSGPIEGGAEALKSPGTVELRVAYDYAPYRFVRAKAAVHGFWQNCCWVIRVNRLSRRNATSIHGGRGTRVD